MSSRICVRFLLVVAVLATLVGAKSVNRTHTFSPENASSAIENNDTLNNFTEEWMWSYPVNSSEVINDTADWDNVLSVRRRALSNGLQGTNNNFGNSTINIEPEDQATNWCARVGVPFEKMNFSRFQLTNQCCKEHVQSVLVKVKEELRYKCSADSTFYDCLKRVNTTMSKSIGDHYFNVPDMVGRTCYDVEEDSYCQPDEPTFLCSVVMAIQTKFTPPF